LSYIKTAPSLEINKLSTNDHEFSYMNY